MATTLVSWASKGRATKRTLYVGGLDDKVDQNLLHAAFIPFGDIKDVSIPLDFKTGKHRGFGFVEFEEKEDEGIHLLLRRSSSQKAWIQA